jgi:hypothetical protein
MKLKKRLMDFLFNDRGGFGVDLDNIEQLCEIISTILQLICKLSNMFVPPYVHTFELFLRLPLVTNQHRLTQATLTHLYIICRCFVVNEPLMICIVSSS